MRLGRSSKLLSGLTVSRSRLITSETLTHAGHLFSAAILSEISLWEMTPTSLPPLLTTPAERTSLVRRYCAASSTFLSSRMEKPSVRDPIRSATLIGPSGQGFRYATPSPVD